MSTALRERLDSWIRVQLSDTPWLVAGVALGALTEAAAWGLGGYHFTAPWIPWAKVIGFYGYLLGYTAFRFNRSATGWVLGGLAGAAYVLADRFVYPLQRWDAGPAWLPAVWVAWTAALPYVVDRVVDPHLLRGPLRRMAAWHPRYARLRGRAEKPSSHPSDGGTGIDEAIVRPSHAPARGVDATPTPMDPADADRG